jgi:hypothetical protein
MSDDFKSYIVFKKGSYWVYEETSTNEIDSIFLHRSEIAAFNGAEDLGYNGEKFTAGYSSSLLVNDSIRGFAYPSLDQQKYYVYEEFRFSDFLYAPYVFFGSNDIGSVDRFQNNSKLIYENFFSALDINGKSYTDVKVFHNAIQNQSYQPERIFFAKGVGVIKKEMFSGKVWELKRYLINK